MSPFDTRERFVEFVDLWSTRPGWACVVGYDDTTPVGYAYGAPLATGSPWWSDVHPLLAGDFTRETGRRTFALSELMVTRDRRGTGAAAQIHDELLRHRQEERATLAVDAAHPRVRALYERWRYTHVGQSKPFDDSPLFDIMIRDLS
ncbi:GNAT family N-acetyltransferase [Streptomyces sp. AV19]|nr:GNAT family N-acetyltransferase [Streptomyces sp. AV19]